VDADIPSAAPPKRFVTPELIIREIKLQPTIPYVLGIMRRAAPDRFPGEDALEDVLRLFDDFLAVSPCATLLSVRICEQLKVPVFWESPRVYTEPGVCFPSRKAACIHFADSVNPAKNVGLNEVVEEIYSGYKHAHAIELQLYSCDPCPDGNSPPLWRQYDAKDERDIDRVLAA
jgi:hypothetical protein